MRNRMTWLGLVVIGAVTLTMYSLSLGAGFVWDDWDFLTCLIRLSFPAYLTQFFDPRVQFMWYRPLSGMLWWVNYQLFGVNPAGYHLVGMLIHTANCLLLFALTKRVSGSLRLGFVAAVIYVGIPLFNNAVFWPADAQIQATLFYLLAVWFWMTYLETGSKVKYAIALVFSLSALVTKETSITLPVTLFLVDRLLVRKPATWQVLFQRYLPHALFVLFYLAMMYRALTYGLFPNQLGYRPGGHLVANLILYLALLAFPWGAEMTMALGWLIIVFLLFIWSLKDKAHRRELLFVACVMVLTTLPVSMLPEVKPRYMYTPTMMVAVFFALGVEAGWRMLGQRRSKWIVAAAVSLLVIWSGSKVGEASLDWAELSRIERVPFRTIAQRHAQFTEDTYLYFINRWAGYLSGMFLARYGPSVIVQDVVAPHMAGLRDHRDSIVIYFDDQNDPKEIAVNKDNVAQVTFSMPPEFYSSIQLVGYELVSTRIKRGEPLALILYWKATRKIDKDYTVFVHLVDSNGNVVVGNDSQPRSGTAPTTSWSVNALMPDGIFIPIPPDAPIGDNCRLEVGLYYLPTLQRLLLTDGSDHIVIEPIQIVP